MGTFYDKYSKEQLGVVRYTIVYPDGAVYDGEVVRSGYADCLLHAAWTRFGAAVMNEIGRWTTMLRGTHAASGREWARERPRMEWVDTGEGL